MTKNYQHPLEKILEHRIAIIDGAMGTTIRTYGMQEEDIRGKRFKDATKGLLNNGDLFSLTQPQMIAVNPVPTPTFQPSWAQVEGRIVNISGTFSPPTGLSHVRSELGRDLNHRCLLFTSRRSEAIGQRTTSTDWPTPPHLVNQSRISGSGARRR